MTDKPKIRHFSDLLCVWAYVANIRLERMAQDYGDRVDFDLHFCSVFPDTATKIAAGWADRGGAAGYGAHVQDVVANFDHVTIHPDVWVRTRPASSTAPHLFLAAAGLVPQLSAGPDDQAVLGATHRLTWALRHAFFAEGRDIATWAVQADCAAALGYDPDVLRARIDSGAAAAVLDRDVRICQAMGIAGSPTFVMNDARQTLYGNVGYHLLKANVDEMLRGPAAEDASWC